MIGRLADLDLRRAALERAYQASDADDPPAELLAIEHEILRAPAQTLDDLGIKVRQLRREAGMAFVGQYLVQFETECQRILGYEPAVYYGGRDE